MTLAGKVAIVTGATESVGGAVVKRLAADGATVIACDVAANGAADSGAAAARLVCGFCSGAAYTIDGGLTAAV